MSRPRQSPGQLQAMRERILDAARAVLATRGPQALSTRAVAEQLGMAHMSLYTYFHSKSELIGALAERETAKLRARQQALEARAAGGEDIAAVMREALALYAQVEREDPALFRLAWVMPLQGPEHSRRVQARVDGTAAHLARLIRQGMARGVFRALEPDLAAAAVWGMVNFPLVLLHSGRLPDPSRRDALEAEMLDAAMGYLTGALPR